MIEPLISFFAKKAGLTILIDCPHQTSDDIMPKIEYYKKGTLVKRVSPPFLFPPFFLLKPFTNMQTQPMFKIRDFFMTFFVLLREKNTVDMFIGLESIFTLVGIVFKKIGKVKTVIYYVSDYSPTRYSSKLFNAVYLWLDRICATHADYIWDVSKAMMPARLKNGLDTKKAAPVIHVPNGLFPWQIRYKPIEQLEPYSIAFAGTIGPENGLDLAIQSLAIARQTLPSLKLHVFGVGPKDNEQTITRLIKRLKLEEAVVLHGFISDLKVLSDKLSYYMVGLAPYTSLPWSVRWYADATKMRLYFGSGLPVITTQVPPLGREAREKGCAIVVRDAEKEIAQAIIHMFRHRKNYVKFRENAIAFAKKNTWDNTYKTALSKMQLPA
jgi:glycosyltransferase involved in cell wall biosynthesis